MTRTSSRTVVTVEHRVLGVAFLVTKTLFGEEYVALEVPESSDGTPISDGDTITDSRVDIEVEEVLAELGPLSSETERSLR